ncbi:MAG: xylulokinase [Candidatus Saccharicenans sp.]|uniref:xylulokinase n=1 Tax=Candidatus Saccharicenans sp. TaxID=2819258 RepID=UPI00404A516C
MYALGLDSGTQGTKALVVDIESGQVVGRGYARHRMIEGLKPGESEQDPGEWILAMEQAIGQSLQSAGIKPAEIVCLGLSGQQHGFVPLDQNHQPIRPAKLWNDTSTVEETEEIIKALGGKKNFIEKLGLSLAVGYTASKILWLKKHEPENYTRMRLVLLPHNYLNLYLTGRPHMEYGDASGTGLMDIRNRCWHQEALRAIDPELEGKLPPLSHPAEPVGYIRPEIAARFNLGRVLVSAGGGDNMMAAIGTGNVSPGLLTVSLGTSGTIFSYSDRPFLDPEGEIAAFCDSTGGWLPLLCTMNVTNATELLKELLALNNEELEALAASSPPGAAGLIFLPFIDGERVPVLPQASGVFFGLTRQNFNRQNLARAVIEGTVFNLDHGFSRLRGLGLEAREIRATGGGARSRTWLQVLADIFANPVVTLKEPESAAYGAALQAIWCYRNQRNERVALTELVKEMVKKDVLAASPRPENLALYQELQARFNSLWQTLAPEFSAQRSLLQTRF